MAPMMAWLNAARCTGRVRGSGSRTCCAHATGKRLDPADFTAHLTARYLS
jgi:hypothetical protein